MPISNDALLPQEHGKKQGQGRKQLLMGAVAILALSVAACSTSTPSARTGHAATAAQGQSLYGLAQSAAERGDHSAAVPLYRAALKQDSNINSRLGLSRSLMALGQYVEAERVLRRAGSLDDNPDAQAALGTVLLALGQADAAAALFDAAAARAPRLGEALRGQALAADLLGRHGDAVAIYSRAVDGGEADLRMRNNYGLSLTLHGDAAAGAEVLEGLVRERAGGAGVRQNLALAYVFTGDPDKARSLLLVDMDPARADRQLANYQTLKAMEPAGRLQALMTGAKAEPRDSSAPAVEAFSDGPIRHDAALATVGVEIQPVAEPDVFSEVPAEYEPEPEHQPAPVAPADQADADLSHIPMLEQSGWALQLAAYRKASQLVAGWELLRTANADIIGHLPPRRTEIDFGARSETPSGFYYRLNAGPLTDRAEAESLCVQLRERGTDCWVRPPEEDEGSLPQPEEVSEDVSADTAAEAAVETTEGNPGVEVEKAAEQGYVPEAVPAQQTSPEPSQVAA